MDALAGYRRFALGIEAEDEPLSRAEVVRLDRAVADWRRTGHWRADHDG